MTSKFFVKTLSFLKCYLLPFSIILLLTFIVWHKVLGQAFLGEAYYYFDQHQHFITDNGIIKVNDYDNFARMLFNILPLILRDNIQLYLIFQLLTFLFIYFSLFYILFKITKSKLLSLTATILFMSSYVGSYEMMAIGNYQRFVQRVPNFIPFLFSFFFLIRYYETQKLKHYVYSLSLFTLSVFMAHYTTFLAPLLLIYPIIKSFGKPNLQNILKAFLISGVFGGVVLWITGQSDQKPTHNMLQFILTEDNLIEKVILQIPLATIPHDFIVYLADNFFKVKSPYIPVVKFLLIPTLLIYLTGGIIILKKYKGLFTFYLTILFAVVLEMFIYQYVDGEKMNILKGFGQDRHFFIPSLLVSIDISVILYAIFGNRKKLYYIVTLIFLTSSLIYNTNLIWQSIDSEQYKSEMMKKYVAYVKQQSWQFNSETIISTPSYLIWPSSLIAIYYSSSDIKFLTLDEIEKIPIGSRKDVFVFDYDQKMEKDKNNNAVRNNVVDFTTKYRRGEPIKFLYD